MSLTGVKGLKGVPMKPIRDRLLSIGASARRAVLRPLAPAVMLGAAVLACPAPAAADAPNGLSGTFGESDGSAQVVPGTGAMTYSIPFRLPEARGTAQPSLSLNYISGAGTGDAGQGWSLNIPSIERTPLAGAPKYLDPPASAAKEYLEDRYGYAGRALTFVCVVGGSPACPATEAAGDMPPWATGWRHYRLQVEGTFERFFLNSNRTTWIVQRRGGEILEFGVPITSPALTGPATDVQGGTSKIFRWNLARQHDRHGVLNTIVYSWAGTSPERQYLRDIYYSSGAGTTVDDFAYHVELRWQAAAYRQYDYAPMARRRQRFRLSRVAVSSKTWADAASREMVRAYQLAYFDDRAFPALAGQAPTYGNSSLKSVTSEGRCAVNEVSGRLPYPTSCPKLPPVTFDYQPTQLATGVAIRSEIARDPVVGNDGLYNVVNSAMIDVNRDGLPDIVQAWAQNIGDADNGGRTSFYGCNGSEQYIGVAAAVDASNPPVLVCTDSNGRSRPLAPAAEQIAYINRGAFPGASVNLAHHCLDPGDGSPDTVAGRVSRSPGQFAALFNQFSAEAVGVWGDAVLLWSVSGYGGLGIQPTVATAAFCGNTRNGAPSYPALKWQLIADRPTSWARYPVVNEARNYRKIVDIDGDGYSDLLTDPSNPGTSPSGSFKRASVRFTSKISSVETYDVGPSGTSPSPGPALIPFATSPVSSDAVTITPVNQSFSTYADINGDGIVDLITAQNSVNGGTPRVRPGDGRGGFGCDSARGDVACNVAPDGAWVGKAFQLFVPDAAKPWPLRPYSPYWLNSVDDTHFFHDVTGDGLADIVAYRPANWATHTNGTIKLWVNVDGRTFRCANTTNCVVATIDEADQPYASLPKYRVVFTDFDGNGTEDFVLLGETGVWHFSFLTVPFVPAAGVSGTRSPRPGLLTRIRNGVGAETEVVYETIQELESKFTDTVQNSFRAPWSTHSPLVIPVVTRIATRDSRVVAGAAPVEPYQVNRSTRFEYRDPAYDPWERSFKGWGRVRATDRAEETVQTWFWFSPCESGGFTGDCPGGSDMSPDKALVGAVVRVDRFVARAPGRPTDWLSTTTRLTRDVDLTRVFLTPPTPSSAPGDRSVLFAAVQEENTYLYDTSLPASEVNRIGRPDELQEVPLQSGSERRLRTSIEHDAVGNMATVIRWGHVKLGGPDVRIDPVVRTTSTFDSTPECKAAWGCLPTDVKVFGDLETNSLAPLLRHTNITYDATTGDVASMSAELLYPEGHGAALSRLGATSAPAPASASTAAGMKPLRVLTHDAYGNVTKSVGQLGASRPCTKTIYDGAYNQFPETVAVYTGDGCTGGRQRTALVFDRGIGAQSAAMFANQTMQTTEFDAFGRISAIYAPAPDAGSATELAVQITHHTTSPVSWTEIATRVDYDRFVRSIEIVNGIGEPVLAFDQADTVADGAPWIARSWTERDVNGVPTNRYRPWFYTGDAYTVAATAPALATIGNRLRVVSDEFGRPVDTFDGATQTAHVKHAPLSTTVQDASQLSGGGPFVGLSSRRRVDGFGRMVETTTPAGDGGDTTTTQLTYRQTGEPLTIERHGNADPAPYVRTMEWDSFGRLIRNHEPNTSQGTAEWRYVYDDEGRLVGTSDARGCGKNLTYDALGRTIGEDYSPCLSTRPDPQNLTMIQPAWSAPDPATGDGYEVFYRYDSYEAGQVAPTATFDDDEALAIGQLVSVRDRGAATRFNYDGRGRVRRTSRQMAKPDAANIPTLADRYATRWFEQETELDLGDRLRKRTTGAVNDQLPVEGAFEAMTYSERGALRAIGSSYGDLVSGLTYSASGQPRHVDFGDRAATTSDMDYDARDRLARYRVSRAAAPALWATTPPPNGYTLPSSETTQLQLAYLEYVYDAVSNPIAITHGPEGSWPAGAQPLSRIMAYDAANRIARVDYIHGGDTHVSPYRPEADSGDRRPIAEQFTSGRILSQDFATDAQGNVTASDDDAHLRFDRSLGAITNGIGIDGTVHGPNQLIDADGMHATYDPAGNLVELTVARDECWSRMPACSHRFVYDWDETGQLQEAKRYDYPAGAVPGFDSQAVPAWDLTYAYSQGGRTRTTTVENGGDPVHTLDVFGSLRLVHVGFDTAGAPNDYNVMPESEIAYLGGLARVFLDRDQVLPSAGSSLHVFLVIGDHLGSSAFTLDKDSGELVERTTHQAYGALETDYRPDRWGNAREKFKFTGKEEDIEVGATYFGARYYQARLGRWMSADPMTVHDLGADPNPYAYVSGRVTSRVDRFGFCAAEPGTDDCVEVVARMDPGETVTVTAPSDRPQDASMMADRGHAASQGNAKPFGLSPARMKVLDKELGQYLERARYDQWRKSLGENGVDWGCTGTCSLTPWWPEPQADIMPIGPGVLVEETLGARVGSYARLREAGAKDAHHVIQDAAARELAGYSRGAAPAVELPGPSTLVGSPHYGATQLQRQAGGGTYAAERRIGYRALRKAGVSAERARSLVAFADEYFASIGVGPSTPMRIPGNRYSR